MLLASFAPAMAGRLPRSWRNMYAFKPLLQLHRLNRFSSLDNAPHPLGTCQLCKEGKVDCLQKSDGCAVLCCVQRQKEIVKISVGAQAVNELLGGGIESRCITEIYGEFR